MSERDYGKNSFASEPAHMQAELPTQGTALNPVEAKWLFSSTASSNASNSISGNSQENS